MHDNFRAISLSHKSAPVAIREQLALNNSETKEMLEHIRELYAVRDILVLSTCNRTEIYYASQQDLSQELIKTLALKKGVECSDDFVGYFHQMDHHEAVSHLFEVAIGLQSQIIGDMQITNQVKNAYQMAADADVVGPFLHRLLHTTFYVNKKVVQETAFRDGAASMSYATLELVEQLSVNVSAPVVLIMGLGTIGTDLAKNLADHRSSENYRIVLTNRTLQKAEILGQECGFEVLPWEQATDFLHQADIVVSAVGSQQPVVTHHQVSQSEILNYKYFIDLSMPRSIDPSVESINGAVLYNLDDIQSRTDQALQRRLKAVPAVEAIVEDSISSFQEWGKEMSVNPTINKLKNALEQIRKEELARHLKNANENEVMIVDKVTKSIMQKVIKLPVLQLKAACKRGEAETLIDLLNDLFNLEKEPTSDKGQ